MSALTARLGGLPLRDLAPPALLVGLVVLVELFAPGFVTRDTLLMVLSDTAVLFLLATAETFVILLGGIDLSIQAVASLASVIVAQLLPTIGPAAYAVAILAGLLSGLASGFVHVRLRVPSFVATLATGGVVAGLALLSARGRAITIEEGGRLYTTWLNGTLWGAPVVVILSVVVGLAGFVVLRYTRFGRFSVAVGAGEPAAWAAGVNVDRTKIMAFAVSGTLAALAGVVLAARLSSGSPNLANQLMLPAIAAVIVGGGDGHHGWPRQRRPHRGRRPHHLHRPHRHDLCRRQHLRRERRVRRHADRRRGGDHRSQQDRDHQMSPRLRGILS